MPKGQKVHINHEPILVPDWNEMAKRFKSVRLRVMQVLMENGISIRNGELFINDIRIPISSVAEVANVDRRIVSRAIRDIESSVELKFLFKHMRASPSLKEIARGYGTGVLEIDAVNKPGTFSQILSILARRGISIRQLVADDYELSPKPKLTVVTYGKIPSNIVDELLELRTVRSVKVYSTLEK